MCVRSFLLFLVALSCLFTGCVSGNTAQSTLAAQSAFLKLKQQFPITASSASDPYLRQVTDRLQSALPQQATEISPAIFLVHTAQPIAVAGPSGEILLSTGFLASLENEAQLVFVLAHELAHSVLQHTGREHTLPSAAAAARFRQEAELAADAQAVSIMSTAGYDPRQATRALAFVYMLQGIQADLQTHPEFRERVFAIQSAITRSSWLPSGIATSRSFNQFRRRVVGASMPSAR